MTNQQTKTPAKSPLDKIAEGIRKQAAERAPAALGGVATAKPGETLSPQEKLQRGLAARPAGAAVGAVYY